MEEKAIKVNTWSLYTRVNSQIKNRFSKPIVLDGEEYRIHLDFFGVHIECDEKFTQFSLSYEGNYTPRIKLKESKGLSVEQIGYIKNELNERFNEEVTIYENRIDFNPNLKED